GATRLRAEFAWAARPHGGRAGVTCFRAEDAGFAQLGTGLAWTARLRTGLAWTARFHGGHAGLARLRAGGAAVAQFRAEVDAQDALEQWNAQQVRDEKVAVVTDHPVVDLDDPRPGRGHRVLRVAGPEPRPQRVQRPQHVLAPRRRLPVE